MFDLNTIIAWLQQVPGFYLSNAQWLLLAVATVFITVMPWIVTRSSDMDSKHTNGE